MTIIHNMKMYLPVLFVVLLAVSHSQAFADGKIAVLSVTRAVMNTEAAEKELSELRNRPEVMAAQKRLDGLTEQGNKMLEKLRKEEATMSDADKLELQRRIALIRSDVEYEGKKLQELEQGVQQQIVQKQSTVVQKIINDLIEEEGIGLLLRDLAQVPVVLHVDTTYDITPKVTAELNKLAQK